MPLASVIAAQRTGGPTAMQAPATGCPPLVTTPRIDNPFGLTVGVGVGGGVGVGDGDGVGEGVGGGVVGTGVGGGVGRGVGGGVA